MSIDLRPILAVLGVLLSTLGLAMLVPAMIDLAQSNPDWEIFATTCVLTTGTGAVLFLANRGIRGALSTRQALVMTAAAWTTLAAFGALPYQLSGVVPGYTDAFFESMSALTTTGATVIVGLEDAPPGILMWRAIQQWLGGLGIIVMAVAVLPMLQIGGMQLFKAEAFDTAEKILPRATQISGSLTGVFVGFTIACAFAYLLAGMTPLDAFAHAMTTVATGGHSTHDASIAWFDSAQIEIIATVFMLAGAIPFILYVQSLQGSFRGLLKDQQVRLFLTLIAIFSAVAYAMALSAAEPEGMRTFITAAFNVTSIMTGTGYASTNYGAWGPAAVAFFFIIMFIGGCAGSTSCGIKIFRFQVLYQIIRQHLHEMIYPNGIYVKRFNGRPINDDAATAVLSFFFLYFLSFMVLAAALNLTGLDLVTAYSGAGSAISNVGPGLGDIIGPTGTYEPLNPTAKWLLAIGMLIGRLELFTILVLFIPRFWRT
ncbi:MAG: TrkH family potassium uptake protein [Pseudomonadota bacterium]